jgi:hypothetical protein
VLEGEKIMSRKRGFTVDTCVSTLSAAAEDGLGPQFQGLPTGEKASATSKWLQAKVYSCSIACMDLHVHHSKFDKFGCEMRDSLNDVSAILLKVHMLHVIFKISNVHYFGRQVRIAGVSSCQRAEGTELPAACARSCETACSAAMQNYVLKAASETGILVEEKEKIRMTKSCTRDCRSECTKPGKAFDFVSTSRR